MAGIKENLSFTCDLLLLAIFVVATVSNFLVLLVFYRRPGLRTISNRFVINLLGTNLLSCWVLVPVVLGDNFSFDEDNEWSTVISSISQGLSCAMYTASVFAVLLIGLDQYYAIVDPLHYHSRIDNLRSAFMISASWLLTIVIGVFSALFLRGSSSFFTSTIPALPQFYVSLFGALFSVLVFILPFSCLCWIYISIYSAAHNNSRRARRNGSSACFYPSSPSESGNPEFAMPVNQHDHESHRQLKEQYLSSKPPLSHCSTKTSLRSTSSLIVNTLKYRISNASLFRYREETRAARISALVVVMTLLCWFPFTLVLLMKSPMWSLTVPYELGKVSLTLLASSTIVSSLLFAHRNRRIQRELHKLLGSSHHHSNFYNSRHSTTTNKCVLPVNYSHTALELPMSLAENPQSKHRSGNLLTRIWCRTGSEAILSSVNQVSVKSTIGVHSLTMEDDNSRSSFSSGESSATQTSTSAASISDAIDEC